MKYIGERLAGRTNRKLAAGRGRFVADIHRDGMHHASFVRSPYAAARIRSIDARAAEAMSGVVAVVTGEEVAAKMNPIAEAYDTAAVGAKHVDWYALAPRTVHYVGEPVAVVVAADKYTAAAAAEAVEVEYQDLPVVSDPEDAMQPDAPVIEPAWGDNILITRDFQSGDVDAAFAAAEATLSGSVRQHRYTGTPIEPRAYLADYDAFEGKLTMWASTQNPHPLRVFLAATLGIKESQIRVIQPDVGGAFGLKVPTFQEEAAIAYLALKLGRPVKWVAERSEDFLTGGHARETRLSYEVAYQKDGTVTGLRARVIADVGAPSALCGWGMSFVTAFCIPTVYKIPNNRVQLFSVVTNKCPWNGYRGYGKEAASFLMERVMDGVARATGLDRAEVRLRNFVPPADFPYPQVSGAILDSGDYPKALRRVLENIGYEGFRAEQDAARRDGRYLGIGLAYELTPEGCSMPRSTLLGGFDGATVRVNPSGQITVLTGVTSPGSGNETGIAQIVADSLGADIVDIEVVQGDTDRCPYGLGNYSSRSVIIGGSAARLAAIEIREKMEKIAANMLEVSVSEIQVEDSQFSPRGAPVRSVSFRDVATTVYTDSHGKDALPFEPGLEATRYYRIENVYHQPEVQGRFSSYPTWPNAAAACIVEVDAETGVFKILRYCVVHDCGTVINPLLVDGQLHGGIAQGIGGAVFENLVYDEGGQLLTTTFMDYTCPTAVDLPSFEVDHQETLSPFTPLGAKGAGESGVASPLASLPSAIEDAFRDIGVRITELPLSPDRVWRAIQEGRARTRPQ